MVIFSVIKKIKVLQRLQLQFQLVFVVKTTLRSYSFARKSRHLKTSQPTLPELRARVTVANVNRLKKTSKMRDRDWTILLLAFFFLRS